MRMVIKCMLVLVALLVLRSCVISLTTMATKLRLAAAEAADVR